MFWVIIFDILLSILDISGYLITPNLFPIHDKVKKMCIVVNFDPKMTRVNFNGILCFQHQLDEERLKFMVLNFDFGCYLVQEQNSAFFGWKRCLQTCDWVLLIINHGMYTSTLDDHWFFIWSVYALFNH